MPPSLTHPSVCLLGRSWVSDVLWTQWVGLAPPPGVRSFPGKQGELRACAHNTVQGHGETWDPTTSLEFHHIGFSLDELQKRKRKKIRKGLMSEPTRCGSQKHPFDGIWETYFFKQSTFKSDLKSPAARLGPVCIPFIHRLLASLPINSILRAALSFSGDNAETTPL